MQQSFLDYSQTGQGQPMTDEQKRQAIAQHFQQQIMGQQAQNPMQGAAQMMTGLGQGLQRQQSAYPAAPGGAQPNFATKMGNLFSFGNNGGLY